MKILWMELTTWKWQGCVIVGGKSSDFAAWAKKHLDADITTGENACGHAYVAYGKPFAIWVQTLSAPELAHEALHATAGILEARGLTHTAASEEAYTYTMENILCVALRKNVKWSKA